MAAAGYPIRAVSKLTGLPLDTLRAWERRYRAVQPRRGERGRVYVEADVRRLVVLRDLVAQGYAIGQVARLNDRQLRALIERQLEAGKAPGLPGKSRGDGRPRMEQIESVLGAVLRFDYAAADRELGRLATVLSARDVIHRVALPLMRAVGEQWHAGKMSIAQEHLASALVRNLLGGLIRLYSPEQPPVRLMFTTPAGEEHEFGILTAAMLAAGGGLGVIYLGPNLPASETVLAARSAEPDVLVLGIAGTDARSNLLAEVQEIAKRLPPRMELWLGGKESARFRTDARGRPAVLLPDFTAFEHHLRRLGAKF
jgi:DNA-binding transcriptional MerR regulator/methylmalonyl-CoA mutase cobalamin-binding subunit